MNAFSMFLQSPHGRRLSQAAWGRQLGISKSYVAHLASGRRVPSLDLAFKIENLSEGVVTMQSWMISEALGEDGCLQA